MADSEVPRQYWNCVWCDTGYPEHRWREYLAHMHGHDVLWEAEKEIAAAEKAAQKAARAKAKS